MSACRRRRRAAGTTTSCGSTRRSLRVYQQHAFIVRYLGNRRDAYYPDIGDSSQSRGTVGLFYTYLGHDRFGAVEWRRDPR